MLSASVGTRVACYRCLRNFKLGVLCRLRDEIKTRFTYLRFDGSEVRRRDDDAGRVSTWRQDVARSVSTNIVTGVDSWWWYTSLRRSNQDTYHQHSNTQAKTKLIQILSHQKCMLAKPTIHQCKKPFSFPKHISFYQTKPSQCKNFVHKRRLLRNHNVPTSSKGRNVSYEYVQRKHRPAPASRCKQKIISVPSSHLISSHSS